LLLLLLAVVVLPAGVFSFFSPWLPQAISRAHALSAIQIFFTGINFYVPV
jgi:hypothetical protein